MLLEFDVDIPEDRRLTVELPPEFPTGPQRIANRLIKLSTDSSSSSEFDIQAIIVKKKAKRRRATGRTRLKAIEQCLR